ncbi:heavy-metal-associated domain-containing protein [Roseivirga sp. UBA1976]|uniref:heavy-metal-associated domain-containing protein n=1 Tax=Roseivirga sp. UBA1976 TaxID=1947386 RepID=UPI00257A39A0|nr:heavy-metal-associated domain-containing protein [Roseivirga sp. UBA1976]MEC7753699.1 heavy-metal-associated domain-containing protein [Bacteroidota bacterium]|tara:strand:+ start:2005 stop:2232 length:228 start_codon:yes stop_codon:yes gene_type:complete
MKKSVFKTNINCGGCVATVTPFLEKANSVKRWEVDTNSKEKKLTVTGEYLDKAEVINLVKEAGFEIKAKKGLFRL